MKYGDKRETKHNSFPRISIYFLYFPKNSA